jgi:SAM-dependent methyltransferase
VRAVSRTGYWAATAPADEERGRLELLQARSDPLTTHRLAALGVTAGWTVWEAGAGAGSVAGWLADRVGPTGRVVATDRDPRFLGGAVRAGVHVLQHDLLADPVDAVRGAAGAGFDLVHCRALLAHLPDPAVAVARMAAALRPGGRLLVEEADYVCLAAADPRHPAAPAFDRLVARAFPRPVPGHPAVDHLFDAQLGRRLPGLLTGCGLRHVGHDVAVGIRRGSDPAAEFLRRSVLAAAVAAPTLVPDDPTDRDLVTAALRDPTFAFLDAAAVAAWGRRPGRWRVNGR